MDSSLANIELLASQLSNHEKSFLIKLLNEQLGGSECLKILEQHCIENNCCPGCQSQRTKRYGKANGRQRHRCNECGKTFMCTTNTPFHRLRMPEKWLEYFTAMLNSSTVRKSARECDVSKSTSFRWRHRFLRMLTLQDNVHLSGIVEVDETLFRYSEKGSRNLGRSPHKRGRDKAGRGRKKGDWAPVLIARDRHNETFGTCLESEKAGYISGILEPK